MKHPTLNVASALVALFLSFSSSVLAQTAAGTMSGTVTDASGSEVPNAQIAIRNQNTDVKRTVVSNGHGFYSAPGLSPGSYEITITASGFGEVVLRNLVLNVGGEVVTNTQLSVGSVSEKVEVTGQAPAVDLGSSTLTSTVTGQTVRDLPLNGRDWTQLATLEPGVKTIGTQNPLVSGSNSRLNGGWGTQITISGNRPQQNNYRLDGISINDYSGGGPGSVLGASLGVDAIQEFSVVTSTASAEYGKTSGGVLNAITRAGTNELHGALYEFLRNSALDARNFFDGAAVPPFKRNQFGGAIGGPLWKDHTFFFFDYEAMRQRLSTTNLLVVPSLAARSGQLVSGQVTVDPKVAPYLALFPLPNRPGTGDTGVYSFVAKDVTDQSFFETRVDHQLSQADSLHGTFMNDDSQDTGVDSYDILRSALISRRHLATVEESHIFSSALANIARAGYSRVVGRAPVPVDAISPLASDTSLGFVPGRPVGTISIAGISGFQGGLGSQAEYDFHYNSYQLYDDVYYTRQAHSLKFGVAIERIQANQLSLGSTRNGGFGFGSLAAFLSNVPSSFSSLASNRNPPPIDLRQTVAGTYVQDDWRLRPNLTLNLGLRYEMATVPTETSNRLSTLVNITDAKVKIGSPFFKNPTLKNFSPRVGFSWDPFHNGKTAIRSAFGIYDTLPLTYQFETLSLVTTPFAPIGGVNPPPAGSFPTAAYPLLSPVTASVNYIEQNPKRPYVEQWNFNIQRQIGDNVTVQIGYTGSHGVHQPFRSQNANIVLPTETPAGLLWPTPRGSGSRLNPNFGSINTLVWQASSSYHGLNFKVTRRIGHGLHLGGSYTWAKTIDINSASLTGGQFTNSVNALPIFWTNLWRGLSDFDVRHNLVVNTVWELPSPRWASGHLEPLLKGWQLNGIFQASSGQPFTPVVGGDALGLNNGGNAFDFPNRLSMPGCNAPVNPGNPDHYIKTECFAAPNPTTLLDEHSLINCTFESEYVLIGHALPAEAQTFGVYGGSTPAA